jgi:hypothetical protein
MENDDNIILSIGETLTLIALWKGNIFYWLFYLEYTCKMCVCPISKEEFNYFKY